MSVTFAAYLYDPATRCHEFVRGTPEVNLSNANASAVLAALGRDLCPDYSGAMAPVEFFEAVKRFRRAVLQGRGSEFASDGEDPTGFVQALREAGVAVLSGPGLDCDGIMRRLVAIREVAMFADEHDAELGWA